MKMFPFIGKNFIIVFRLGPTIWRIFRVVGCFATWPSTAPGVGGGLLPGS